MRKSIIIIMLFYLIDIVMAQSVGVVPAVIEMNLSRGTIAERSFEIINPSNKDFMFMIESPEGNVIKLEPYVGKIVGGESKKIKLIFDSRKTTYKEKEFEVHIKVFSDNKRNRGIPINTGVTLKIKANVYGDLTNSENKIQEGNGYNDKEEIYYRGEPYLNEEVQHSKNKNQKVINPIGIMITLGIIIFGLKFYFSLEKRASYT